MSKSTEPAVAGLTADAVGLRALIGLEVPRGVVALAALSKDDSMHPHPVRS